MGTDKPFFALKLEKRAKTSSRRGRVVRTARTCLKSPEDFYHLRIRKWPGGVGPIQPLRKMALVNASLDDIVEARHRDLSHAEKLKMSSSQKPPSSYKVSVSNLKHQDLGVKELTQMFADFGKVLSLKVVTKEGKDEPDVSIRFESKGETKSCRRMLEPSLRRRLCPERQRRVKRRWRRRHQRRSRKPVRPVVHLFRDQCSSTPQGPCRKCPLWYRKRQEEVEAWQGPSQQTTARRRAGTVHESEKILDSQFSRRPLSRDNYREN